MYLIVREVCLWSIGLAERFLFWDIMLVIFICSIPTNGGLWTDEKERFFMVHQVVHLWKLCYYVVMVI
jgi:uncharacterized membrane protein